MHDGIHQPTRIPAALRGRYGEIVQETDRFFSLHFEAGDLMGFAREMVACVARKKDSPLAKGEYFRWAAGVVHAIADLNGLFERDHPDHIDRSFVTRHFRVKAGEPAKASEEIVELLGVKSGDVRFTRKSPPTGRDASTRKGRGTTRSNDLADASFGAWPLSHSIIRITDLHGVLTPESVADLLTPDVTWYISRATMTTEPGGDADDPGYDCIDVGEPVVRLAELDISPLVDELLRIAVPVYVVPDLGDLLAVSNPDESSGARSLVLLPSGGRNGATSGTVGGKAGGAGRSRKPAGGKPTHYEIEVELIGIERPRLWRRFLIRRSATFLDLHRAIQDACGWEEMHLWQFASDVAFTAGRRLIAGPGPASGFSLHTLEELAPDAGNCRLDQWFDRHESCIYEYDFGDDWQHRVTRRDSVRPPNAKVSRSLVAGEGMFPPGDCGGISGYGRLCVVMRGGEDPEDPDHTEDFREWAGNWHPDGFDLLTCKAGFDLPVPRRAGHR